MPKDAEVKELPAGIYSVDESNSYRDKEIDKEFIKKIYYSGSTSDYLISVEKLTGIKLVEED